MSSPYTHRAHLQRSLRPIRTDFDSGDFHDYDETEWVAEASDLGWRAGDFASAIRMDGALYRFTNAMTSPEGETLAWHFAPVNGTGPKLTIFND